MPRLPLLLLPLLACATVKTTERFEVKPDASPEQVIAAAELAATRLGAEVHPGRGAELELRAVQALDGRRHDWVSVKSTKPGQLEISTASPFALGTVSAALAAGTAQLLEDRAVATPPIEPRSVPLAVALDLLMPFAGGLYVDSGDPYGRSWAMRLGVLGTDLAGLALLAVSALGPPGPNPWVLPVLGVVELALGRLIGVMFDLDKLKRRNAAAASGFDLLSLPEPASVTTAEAGQR